MTAVEMSQELLAQELRAVPFLSSLNDDELYALAAFSRLSAFDEGEILIEEGHVNSAFYILMSGTLAVVKTGKWHETQTIAHLRGNATVGETALLQDELSTATVYAAESTVVIIMSREQFTSYIHTHPKAGLVIMTYIIFSLLQRLRNTNEELVDERTLEFDQTKLDKMLSLIQGSPDTAVADEKTQSDADGSDEYQH